LSACLERHNGCNNRTSFRPERLIDLTGRNPRLRLESQLVENEYIEYATLSHCWGKPQTRSCQLTTLTLVDVMSVIPLEKLSKNFRDAIAICKELKIQYIWIDSLFIIQRDAADWAAESITMVNVYGGGILNISASGASDGSQGCFFDRKDMRRCQFPLKINKYKHVLYDSYLHCPLEARGWTLQERLLSPRAVHFTRTEVFWECNTQFVSESSPF
ncbi:HET-domain-containing protein, partial [Mollisia scopiformis]